MIFPEDSVQNIRSPVIKKCDDTGRFDFTSMWEGLKLCSQWLQLMITVITGTMPINPGVQVPNRLSFEFISPNEPTWLGTISALTCANKAYVRQFCFSDRKEKHCPSSIVITKETRNNLHEKLDKSSSKIESRTFLREPHFRMCRTR